MITLQCKIQNYFNKASASYDLVANVQKQAAKFLVERLLRLQINAPKTILDLGTGTGYIPEFLLNKFPNSSYCLNDIADKMLDLCKLKFMNHNNFTFSNCDMEDLDIPHQNLIISNCAMQWTKDLFKTLKKFHNKADIFAFSTLLDGTYKEWQEITLNAICPRYPQKNQLVSYCHSIRKNHIFYHWTKNFNIKFENILTFMKYIQKLGAGASNQNIPIGNLRTSIRNYRKPLSISYKIFFGIFM